MITLRFSTRFAAPAARVFAALTHGHHLERWFCDTAESEPHAGGRLMFRWMRPGSSEQPYEARWTAFDPPRACAFRGGHSGYPHGDAGAIRFTLTDTGDGTLLESEHEFPPGDEYAPFVERYRDAWPRALARLQTYLDPNHREHA